MLGNTPPAQPGNAPVVLTLSDVSIEFGGVTALDDVGFDVRAGQICGLIGPNGAGKTTLFNCITRIYEPSRGVITWQGTDLLGLRPYALASAGIARTFQNLALFGGMSVFDNTMVGDRREAASGSRVGFSVGLRRAPESENYERRPGTCSNVSNSSTSPTHPRPVYRSELSSVSNWHEH